MYNLAIMTDFFNQFDQQSVLIAVIVAAGLALTAWFVSQSTVLQKFRNWRINRLLNNIGREQIRQFTFPDGLGGQFIADRLALTANKIVMIGYRPYRGKIYCAEKIDEWTQVVDRKSFKFANPLFEQNNKVASLSLLIKDIPIEGIIVYSPEVEFPKGKPDRVHIVDQMPTHYLRDSIDGISTEIQSAWEKLKATKRQSDAGKVLALKT